MAQTKSADINEQSDISEGPSLYEPRYIYSSLPYDRKMMVYKMTIKKLCTAYIINPIIYIHICTEAHIPT